MLYVLLQVPLLDYFLFVSACAIPMCQIHCPDGYAKDEKGCDTCNCLVPTVPVQEWKFEKEDNFDPSSNFLSFYSRNVLVILINEINEGSV